MTARTLAIGDIHGCRTALTTLCDSLDLQPDDLLIVLGDIVDRGPDSRRVVEFLMELRDSCRLVFIKGNHEEMMLDSFDSREIFQRWMMFGGRETMDSYQRKMENIPETHRDFLASSCDYHETSTEIYVHANLEPEVVLDMQIPKWLRWQHLTGWEYPHESGRRVICGHTQQKDGVPFAHDGWVCLDTGTYRGNPLTCLEVGPDIVHRADESGKLFSPQPLAEITVAGE